MTKDVVSVLVGTSVRDVAILLLEKRISAIPVLAANLQLVGMVSEGDLIGRSDADRVARRDWWLTLLKDVQPQIGDIEALAAPVDPILTAIERDRIAYVAFVTSVNRTDEGKAAQRARAVTQADEDAHEAASSVGENAVK